MGAPPSTSLLPSSSFTAPGAEESLWPSCSPAPEAVGLLELTSSMSCRRFSPQKAEQEVSKMLGSVGSTGFGGGSGLPVCISLCCLGKREASL